MTIKLKELREIIIKERPEIVELKFGCEILTKDGLTVFFEKKGNKWTGEDYSWFTGLHHNTYDKLRIEYIEIEEIIGRPINQVDILKVLPEGWVLKEDKDRKICEFIDYKYYIPEFFENEYFLWRGNNLNDQSEETINTLHKILTTPRGGVL